MAYLWDSVVEQLHLMDRFCAVKTSLHQDCAFTLGQKMVGYTIRVVLCIVNPGLFA